MINVLKYNDLLKIEEFLRENEMDNGNLSVVMYLETQERLNRINRDYFYKSNPGDVEPAKGDIDEVNIQIGNVTFTYKLRNKNANDQ